MRRKSTRNSTKASVDTEPVPRRSSTRSRRKKSPTPSQDSEDEQNDVSISNSVSNVEEKDIEITKESVNVDEAINDSKDIENSDNTTEINDTSQRSYTPSPTRITGNEATEIEEVDAGKGKSKGLNNSQVEENSEIKMNSVDSNMEEEATNNLARNNEGCPSDQGSIDNTDQKVEISLDKELSSVRTDVVQHQEEKVDIVDNNESSCSLTNVISKDDSVNDVNTEVECESVVKQGDILNESGNGNNLEDDDQTEEGEIKESKSDDENDAYGVEAEAKKPPVRIKLRRNSFFDAIDQPRDASVPEQKKIKWDPEAHQCLKLTFANIYKLNVDDFKAMASDLKLADEKDVKLEETYKPKFSEGRGFKERSISTEGADRPEYVKQSSNVSSEEQDNTNIIALNRKISIVDDSASKLRPPPSPARQPVSPVLFISNLVRPFTIKQLKELLERTGTIKEDGFWTDRIKSKCFVHYETAEEAEATRNALHGVNWPIGNGKKLNIEYSTEEEMEKAKNPPPQPAPVPVQKTPPRAKTPLKENEEPAKDLRNGDNREERKRKDSERERERGRQVPTREWDLGKETRRERSQSRSRDRRRKLSGRSITPLQDFIARKQRKLEESVPQKLMDDLFQRTKTMPCIYWQPLSPEEISIKQQQRLTRMEEHKRRMAENTRNRSERNPGRGAYRRRFD